MAVPRFFYTRSFDFITDSTLGFTLTGSFGAPNIGSPGRSSPHCLQFRNTGFGAQILTLDTPTTNGYAFGFAYRPVAALGSPNDIFYLNNVQLSGVTRLLTIRTRTDHKLDIFAGPLLTNLQTTAVFALGDYHYVEIQYDVGGDVKIYVDDVLDQDMSVTTDPTKPPSTVSHGWSNLGSQGIDIDDVYGCADTAAASTQRVGPVRLTSYYCHADIIQGWGRVGGSTNSSCIADRNGVTANAPDGDSTFVQTTVTASDMYLISPQNDCKGRIIAVATNIVARAPSGGSPTIGAICRPDLTVASNSPIGSQQPLTSSYALSIAYQNLSLRTGIFWTDGEIESCGWGIKSGGSGISRCTMFWVDKIQSLRVLSFNCGQLQSYSYAGH